MTKYYDVIIKESAWIITDCVFYGQRDSVVGFQDNLSYDVLMDSMMIKAYYRDVIIKQSVWIITDRVSYNGLREFIVGF